MAELFAVFLCAVPVCVLISAVLQAAVQQVLLCKFRGGGGDPAKGRGVLLLWGRGKVLPPGTVTIRG